MATLKEVVQWFPLQPSAPACTTSLRPLLLTTNLVFIPSANFTSSLGFFFLLFANKGLLLCGYWIILQLFALCIFLPPTFSQLTFHCPCFFSFSLNQLGLSFYFLKVVPLAQVTGREGRCLGSRGGIMKEDHTENMPCTSLLCVDQTHTLWPNMTVILH